MFEGTILLLQEPLKLVHFVLASVSIVGGYIAVGILFAIFVFVNQGIVVGDRSAHEVHFHPTQVNRVFTS